MSKKGFLILLIPAALFLFSCASPSLDNPFDPENPKYKGSLNPVPRNGLLAEYLFNGNTSDSSGNNYNSTGVPGTYQEDRLGNPGSAMYFNDQWLESPEFQLGVFSLSEDKTISFWYKPGSFYSAKSTLFYHDSWSVYINSSYNTILTFSAGGDTLTKSDIPDETWRHVVLLKGENAIYLYVDGERQSGSISIHNISEDYPDNDFGFGSGDDGYIGLVDDIRIYNRALSQEEIYSLLLEGLWE